MHKQNKRTKLPVQTPPLLQVAAPTQIQVDSCQLFTSLIQMHSSSTSLKEPQPTLCDISLLISTLADKAADNSTVNSTVNSTDKPADFIHNEISSDSHSEDLQQTQHASNDRRFSFLSANPTQKRAFYHNHDIELWQQSIQKERSSIVENKAIPFHSGWIGYFAYPTINKTTASTSGISASDISKPDISKSDISKSESPDRAIAEFNYYPWTICFDHEQNCFHLLGQPDQAAQDAYAWLLRQHAQSLATDSNRSLQTSQALKEVSFSATRFAAVWKKSDYQQAFDKVQAYLLAGDCYQVNLTQPFVSKDYEGSVSATLQPLFEALKPSFGCYFQGQHCELVSMSPERFISIDDQGKLEAKPIKGTIKRSDDSALDNALIAELRDSEKNKAENLMIVDLLRNDLSISATPGSVIVDKLFELESHPNVHHLVSTISAQLQSGTSPAEAISRAFPGGSITGAPKKRAMEIIDELEAQPRSLYCGSFGYFSDSGHVDFNILIRSLEFRDNTITCWGGGGITVDSDCEEEYEESLTKIRRIMDTIEKI